MGKNTAAFIRGYKSQARPGYSRSDRADYEATEAFREPFEEYDAANRVRVPSERQIAARAGEVKRSALEKLAAMGGGGIAAGDWEDMEVEDLDE